MSTAEKEGTSGRKSMLAVKIAICSIACINYLDYVVTPCITDIYGSFDITSTFLQSFVAAGATLTAIPFMLVCGKLAQFLSKKTILLWACVITLAGSVIITFSPTAEVFCVGRALQGCGMGIGVVIANSLMIEQIRDEKELGNFMGIFQGVGAIYAVILSAAAGFIAASSSWRSASLLNWLVFVELIITVFLLPKTPPEGKVSQEVAEPEEAADGGSAFGKLIRVLVVSAIFMVFGSVLYYYADVVVQESGLGDSSLSGMMISVYMVSNTVACLCFGPANQRLGRKMELVFFACAALSYLLLIPPMTMATGFLAMVSMGWAAAWMICYYPILIGGFAPASKMTMYQSAYVVVCYCGMYLCSFLPFWIESGLGIPTMQGTFACNAIALIVGFVIVLVMFLRERKSSPVEG